MRPDLAAWPWSIRIVTLGRFAIELDGKALAFRGKVAKKPLELLQFIIASSGSDVSTATATFALWRELDGDNAKAALNVALHRLRKLLGSDDAVLLELGHLSLNPRLVWVDCLAFEQLADAAAAPPPGADGRRGRCRAARARALRRALPERDRRPAWQIVCRTRLASKFKRMVELRVRAAVAEGDTRRARAVLERALEFDPLAEDLARALMQILIDAGEQAGALASSSAAATRSSTASARGRRRRRWRCSSACAPDPSSERGRRGSIGKRFVRRAAYARASIRPEVPTMSHSVLLAARTLASSLLACSRCCRERAAQFLNPRRRPTSASTRPPSTGHPASRATRNGSGPIADARVGALRPQHRRRLGVGRRRRAARVGGGARRFDQRPATRATARGFASLANPFIIVPRAGFTGTQALLRIPYSFGGSINIYPSLAACATCFGARPGEPGRRRHDRPVLLPRRLVAGHDEQPDVLRRRRVARPASSRAWFRSTPSSTCAPGC